MASNSNSTNSNSSQIHNSGSEEASDPMDMRKRKRMQSNRESARRSRMRKQKHLDDLTDQINQIQKDNAQIHTTINVTTQQFVRIEADNSVLRAQIDELGARLNYLNEIINLMNSNNSNSSGVSGLFEFENHDDFMNNSWNMMYVNQQPIMAAAEMMMQY